MSGSSPIDAALVAGSMQALKAPPRRVLDPNDIGLLTEVSSRLMGNPEARSLPDVMSFAFWCRRGHLRSLAGQRSDLSHNIGRGLAFHIAPSNVPVNFAFSWAFSLLAGNACVVRIPSKPYPQVQLICDAVDAVMRDAGDARTAFVSYDSTSDVTEQLSAIADVRVLWGGDATVSRIKAMASKPRCIDVAFADRYSIALIDADAVAALGDDAIAELASSFYRDTYLMDQNACSSPMTVAWIGTDETAKQRFWSAVRCRAVAEYDLQGAVVTDKYVQFCRDAMDARGHNCMPFDGWLDVVELNPSDVEPCSLGEYRGHGGYFYELDADGFDDIAPLLSRGCQTVAYFGVDPLHVREQVVDGGLGGVDRIVPIGKAMDIDIIWDGMDLLSMMSRKVDAR